MDSKYVEVGVDDYEETSSEQPIIYTRDIKTCIVALIHREETSIMMHIEVVDDNMQMGNFVSVINEIKDEILSVELFKGPLSRDKDIVRLETICTENDLLVNVKELETDDYGSSSLGYNEEEHVYYNVEMEKGIPNFIPMRVNKSLK